MRMYRYGVHDGIKYNPKRTLVYSCKVCGKYSVKKGRTDKYCKICAKNKQLEHNRKWKSNIDKNKHAKNEREAYNKGKRNKIRKGSATTNYVSGKISENVDWDEEIRKIKKLKKATYADSYMHKPEYYD